MENVKKRAAQNLHRISMINRSILIGSDIAKDVGSRRFESHRFRSMKTQCFQGESPLSIRRFFLFRPFLHIFMPEFSNAKLNI